MSDETDGIDKVDHLEKKSKCLFCVEEITQISKEDESLPFKQTKLFNNCAQTLCKVLALPSFPFEYFFDNAGYCPTCRSKIEDLELAVQKIAKLKDTINIIRNELESGAKSAYKGILKSARKRSTSILLPKITNNRNEEVEDLLRNKFTYTQVLKTIVEKVKMCKESGRKRPYTEDQFSTFETTDSVNLGTEEKTPNCNSIQNASPKVNISRTKPKPVLAKNVIKQEGGSLVKKKRGRRKQVFLNPVVVLEKINTNQKSLRLSLGSQVTEPTSSESNGPKVEVEDHNWNENDDMPEEADNSLSCSSPPTKLKSKSRRKGPTRPYVKREKKDKPPPPEIIMKCSVDVCTEIFSKKSDLNAHIKDVHPGLKHNCDKCDKQYLNKKHLLDHQKTKHSGLSETFDCEICGVKFSYGKGLKAHRIRKHKSEYPDIYENYIQNKSAEPIPCAFENCPEVFALKMDLSAHLKDKHKGERRFECELCGKKYINKKHLASHKNIKHSGQYPVVCDKCGKTFNFHKSLLKHMEMQHGEDHLMSCHVCSITFEDVNELEKHTLIHQDEIPFRCDICNTLFTNSRDLKTHVRSHSMKAAKCEICGKVYSSLKNLKDHQLIHNDMSTWPSCDQCKKPFKSARHLRKHMIVHSTENQFQCELCGEGFKYSSYLLKHNRRKHSMLRPFTCLICNKGFYETTQLKRHEEIHSGFKKYICDICGKAFRTLQNHYQHYRTHNKDYQTQMMYKNLKRRALKSSRKRAKQETQERERQEAYSKIEIDVGLLDNFEVQSPVIIQCDSPMDDDGPGHLIPIPADEIHTYYEQGDTIVVVNDMEYHKFTY